MKKRIILFFVFLAIFSQLIFMGVENVIYANYLSLPVLPLFLLSLKTIKISYHIKVLFSVQVLFILSYLWSDYQSYVSIKSYLPLLLSSIFTLSIYNLMLKQKSVTPVFWSFWLCSLFNFLILLKIVPQELFFDLEYWVVRFYGTFNNPNLGSICFVFSILFADYELKKIKKRNLYFYFLFIVILISIALVIATASKKGLLLIVLYFLGKIYSNKKSSLRTKNTTVVGFLLLLVFNFVPSEFLKEISDNAFFRFNSFLEQIESNNSVGLNTGSTSERIFFIEKAIDGFFDSPLYGHGFRSFEAKFTLYSHNNYLELLYSIGIIGFFLYYSIYLKLCMMAFKADAKTKFLLIFSILSLCFIDIAAVTYSTKTIHYFICVLFVVFEIQQQKLNING